MRKIVALGLMLVSPLLFVPPDSPATELVYTPVNPSFGGSPLNSSILLGQAEAQNKFKNKVASFKSDPLDDFEETLNRRILGILANKIVDSAFSEEGLEPGHFVVGDYEIDVGPSGDGVSVVITEPGTGRQTTVSIPNF